jgi:predicted dehydrogenase
MAEPGKMLNLAIIGCGAIVENNHLPALAAVSDFRIGCFIDKDLPRAKALAGRFGGTWSDSIDHIPNDVHVALVAAPNHLHAEFCIALITRGIDVLCEKPMAPSSADCLRILKAAEESQRVFAIAHQFRFHSTIRELRRLLHEGRIGAVSSFDVSLGYKLRWQSRTSFYDRQDLSGGGAMVDTGCHLLDLSGWLFGGIHRAEMNALYEHNTGKRMDTAATVHLDFESGVRGTVRVSRLANLENELTVRGTSGFVRASLTDTNMTLLISGSALCAGGHAARLEVKGQDAFAGLWSRFPASARSRVMDDELSGPREGMRVAEIIDGLYDKGRWECK